MNHIYSIAQRNELVEENLWRIKAVIKRNRALIRAAHMDAEDVYQQLALRLIRAVETFDPDKGALSQHLNAQLRFELLNCKAPYRLFGMTGLPKEFRRISILPYDTVNEADELHEQVLAA